MIDPIELLVKLAKEKHVGNKWIGQPFYAIKILGNSSKGDLSEEFIMIYCRELGFNVEDKKTRLGDYDKIINGKKFEIKMASEDKGGSFQFNHLRYDYKYDFVLCLGISPNSILFQIYSKSDIATGKAGTMVSMGRGQNSSFKLTKQKSSLLPISKFKEEMQSILK